MRIEIQLFGKPGVKIDGQSVEISLKKSEATLYYIAYEKRVTRDEVVGIIWSDVVQEVAKKNLRNSLYRLKKDIEAELFRNPNKHVIELDDTLDLQVDTNVDEALFLSRYKGRFLENFYLKESDAFERWRQEVEGALNQKFLKLAAEKVAEKVAQKNYDEAIELALVMHRIDEFDESVVRILMRLHHALGQFKQISEVYMSLKGMLDEEMGIQPDKETRDQYYALIYATGDSDSEGEVVFGRDDELVKIEKFLHQCAVGQSRKSLILTGEAGVGKSKLLETCLSKYTRSFTLLKMTCYPAESPYAYKSWNDVFSQISEIVSEEAIELPLLVKQVLVKFFPGFAEWTGSVYIENTESINADYLEKLSINLFEKLLKKRRILLAIDDLQWMDGHSLRLLSSLVHHVEGFVFVATLRNELNAAVEHFTAQLYKYDRLLEIQLQRFSEDEAYAFMDYLTDQPLESAIKKRLFEESEGNAFFIVEGTLALKQDVSQQKHRFKGILDSRFIGVEPGEMKLLVIAAMFFDEVEFDMLVKLYTVDEDELLEYIQHMKNRYILKEWESDGHYKLKFTHHKLREHIYEQTPAVKKRILHNRIAGIIEEGLTGDQRDVLAYQKLIYHYSSAGNVMNHLTYYLKYLKTTFDFSHELYPELLGISQEVMDKSPEEVFAELEALFDKVAEEGALAQKSQFLHMKARYHIRHGKYAQGMALIHQLLEICQRTDDKEMLFKAYVQWFYYLIQTDQVDQMDTVLKKIDEIKKTAKNDAIARRLMGISSLMAGRYEEARVHFDASIISFENLGTGGRYVLNIAACYNYISDTFRKQGRMDEALHNVEKAIDICAKHNIMRGSSIFNTNAGIIAFEIDQIDLAKQYFEQALKNFETVDTLWRRSEAEGYLGIIMIRTGQEVMGKNYLEAAKMHAEIIGNPETLKLVQGLEKYI